MAGRKRIDSIICNPKFLTSDFLCLEPATRFLFVSLQKNGLKLFYNIFIFLYPIVAKLISFKNEKAKLWIKGRTQIFEKLRTAFANNQEPVIWMHCSSLGEFEQGRPVLEKIKLQYPTHKILLTFFSPSGFEVRKNYDGADWIFYLPIDSKKNANQFFNIVNPQLIFFVKYEFWNYYLQEAKIRNTPLLLISAIFRTNQPFFKSYGTFNREMLSCITHFFVQNEDSVQLLNSIGISNNVTVAGDTRFDRVLEIAAKFEPLPLIEQFIGNTTKVIVAGSNWTEDDEELDHYANTHAEIKFIIAPHDIDKDRIVECKSLYKNSILFSEWKNMNESKPEIVENINCLIIDNVGMLSKLYKYATICYVGGAFGADGVHNVLEAAVYGKPVVFGPEYDKYIEAKELIAANGGFSINTALELEEILNNLFEDNTLYETTCANAANYVANKAGATDTILSYTYKNRLLTN